MCSDTASGDDDDGFAGWRWLVLFRQKHSSSSAPIFQDPRELDRLSAGGWPGFCVPIQSVAVSTQTHTHTRAQTLASARAKNGIEAPAIRSARSGNFQSAERVYAENDQSDGRDDSLSETILRVELYNKYTYARTPYVNPVTSHTHTHTERESSSSSSSSRQAPDTEQRKSSRTPATRTQRMCLARRRDAVL